MEGDHHHPQAAGDLTDIVRAGGGIGLVELPSTATEWHLSAEPGTLFPPPQPSSSDGAAGPSGDALAALPDPFGISDYRASSAGAAGFFDFEAPAGRGGGGGGALVDSGGGVVMPRGTTTQMPVLSPREIRPYPGIMGGDVVKLGMPTMMPGLAVGPPCAFDAVGGLQMPSPRGGGIKRRFVMRHPDRCQIYAIYSLRSLSGAKANPKNQARKVVCIPAPAALAGGRTTGEVVPSDLWAWRKYGQKPIKGSPYPSNNSSASKNNSLQNLLKPMVKAEPDKIAAAAHTTTTTTTTTSTSNSTPSAMVVKEEEMISSEMEKGMQHATDHDTSVTLDPGDLMQQMFNQSYRPMIPEGGHYDDFFADLAELESDPMSLIFSKEYMETKPPAAGEHGKEMAAPKILADPLFNMLDWGATTAAVANSAGSSSLEQGESGL
ncbi:hypothetical protein PR202_ga02394 [Eleusine coracana subsp. coracana]|uniref:WRKY domain-containing protein n=1 Tax=Eleusine coracana subsp. coracana TaxID=191504 RepID=A0AAV5BK12_ELECO|nr:hypothetical protein PR202_ga02394 [Eleusine coracana subsp. coracana]